jgi:transcriptional regulator with XRE-family HTH domain
VASLAGVSADYYARLERGRERNPSPAVLTCLSTVLRLTPDEHDYLFALAGHARPAREAETRSTRRRPDTALDPRPVRRSVLTALEAMRPSPAFVTNLPMDILAANPAALALFPGVERHPPVSEDPGGICNISRYLFTDPAARTLLQNWDHEMGAHVAHLRSQLARYPDAADLGALIDGLLADSPGFTQLWSRHDVRRRTGGIRHFQHPVAGELALDFESLPLAGTRGHRLILYPTVPGTPEHDAVALLDTHSRDATLVSGNRSSPPPW